MAGIIGAQPSKETLAAGQTALGLCDDPARSGLLITRVDHSYFGQVGQFWTGVDNTTSSASRPLPTPFSTGWFTTPTVLHWMAPHHQRPCRGPQ